MKLLKFDLGKTETYRERVAVWVGGGSTAAAGFLTITTRAGNRTTTVTYAADRVPERLRLSFVTSTTFARCARRTTAGRTGSSAAAAGGRATAAGSGPTRRANTATPWRP